MKNKINFSRVVCDGNEWTYLSEVLESGWLTSGKMTRKFETLFSEAVGAQFSFAVNSCTAALHLGLESLGVGQGDKVLVPTMTFAATAEVVRYLGADPVFVDVEYGSNLVTPSILEKAIDGNNEIKAFIMVHFGGQAANMFSTDGMKGILELCKDNGIKLIEDAAHAFPSRSEGKIVGSIGDITCFSFYANKPITTGEGGMITCDDEGIAKRIQIMRLHGIDRDAWDRYNSNSGSWEYDVIAPGYKYNMPDINAAIGVAQLERAYSLREQRERCARHYLERLANCECLDLPLVKVPMSDHAWHLFVITLNEKARISRNELIRLMAERGIGLSVHFKPLHRTTYYRKQYNLNPNDYPGAEKMWQNCVSLPVYPSLSEEDLENICNTLLDILQMQSMSQSLAV